MALLLQDGSTLLLQNGSGNDLLLQSEAVSTGSFKPGNPGSPCKPNCCDGCEECSEALFRAQAVQATHTIDTDNDVPAGGAWSAWTNFDTGSATNVTVGNCMSCGGDCGFAAPVKAASVFKATVTTTGSAMCMDAQIRASFTFDWAGAKSDLLGRRCVYSRAFVCDSTTDASVGCDCSDWAEWLELLVNQSSGTTSFSSTHFYNKCGPDDLVFDIGFYLGTSHRSCENLDCCNASLDLTTWQIRVRCDASNDACCPVCP